MKQLYKILFLYACFFNSFTVGAQNYWKLTGVHNNATTRLLSSNRYLLYTLDEAQLKEKLFSSSAIPVSGNIISLPLPDGTSMYFKIWQSPVIPAALAKKYPDLKTFTAEAINNPAITAKLDFTSFGFHAIIFNGTNVSFIDPVDNVHSGSYVIHYKKDESRAPGERTICMAPQKQTAGRTEIDSTTRKMAARTSNGYQLRSYRLALSCDHQYAQAVTGLSAPAVSQVLSKMITSINRINGVYEREFAVTMNFAENEDTLIWVTATGSINGNDPFTDIDTLAYSCLAENQIVCDARIGNGNYDIGHVFTTGAGGLSQIGVVCQSNIKARSVTGQPKPEGDGFDIDYVAHEMGHEFGADHPFNNNIDGSCSNNFNALTAYEPGSGSTIMAYAGICAPDDLQPHSDAYFHSVSLQQIQSYITTTGDVCAVKTATNNKLVSLPAFTATYTIPYLTPFELTAPIATDSVIDTSITYCWEQWNLGDPGQELVNTHDAGPIFRSFFPKISPTRVFPDDSMVLAGVLSNAGQENDEGEKAPDADRYLTFRLTVRNIYQGTGCFLIPDDTIHLDVINTGQGFSVTSQSIPGIIYTAGSTQTITWNVAATSTAPINDSLVDIYMSADGGNTWTYHIGAFPNNGLATITVPSPDSTIYAARFKVKGSNNVFFNVNRNDFVVIQDINIRIFPVPASNLLHITTSTNSAVDMTIYNAIGQKVWTGNVADQLDIPVSSWARGVYFLRSTDIRNKRTVKEFVLR